MSICGERYATLLDALGVDAAGSPEIPNDPAVDCGRSVRCCDNAPPDDPACQNDRPGVCSGRWSRIPNDKDHGWIYEPASKRPLLRG